MKKIGLYLLILFQILVLSCKSNAVSETEISQYERNNISDISDNIVDINPTIIFGKSELNILDDIIVVREMYPHGEKGIHLFDKNSLKYLTSTGIVGKGPGEIANPGDVNPDKQSRVFWTSDHSKGIMYKFPLDSVLNDDMFKPSEKYELNNELFLERFRFLNDSIAIGKAIHIFPNSSFEVVQAKLNIKTNELQRFGYEHPEATGKRSNSFFNLSVKDNIYVSCYLLCDLITICDLDGNLKYNIYGPGWFNGKNDGNNYFFYVDFYKDRIFASYSGEYGTIIEGNTKRGKYPSRLIVFDLDGNYLETIETGFEFSDFCIDEDNNRILFYFINRSEPFGYYNIQ